MLTILPQTTIKRGHTLQTTTRRKAETDRLKLHIGDFADFSAAMIVLGELAPERMTLSQAIFFMLTATADLAGKEPTYSDIKEAVGDQLNRSLHTTYRLLLTPHRAYPNGLGWLKPVPDKNDARRKILKLTPEGRKVMETVLEALTEGED